MWQVVHQGLGGGQYQVTNSEFKLPSRKEKESLLLRYAKKLGLNDRGCYLAVGLAVLAFLLLVVIIVMAACWPGQPQLYTANIYFLGQSESKTMLLIDCILTRICFGWI